MSIQNIEKKVSDTILEKPLEFQIGQKIYKVAPPSVATIIMVSEAISRLPHKALNEKEVVVECFSVAKDCTALGEITAILILGAKNTHPVKRKVLKGGKRYLWGLINTSRYRKEVFDPVQELTEKVLKECSPTRLFEIITKIFATLELSDFFALTTFLSEINLLRQTKVEN